ncbi:hypothetical protein MTO96_021999 [Rhipicephalus appendiculatus]
MPEAVRTSSAKTRARRVHIKVRTTYSASTPDVSVQVNCTIPDPTETVGSSFEEYSALASHNCSWSQQQAVALYRMSHYVFVYGTLKSGETNHRILTDPVNGRSTLLGQARTLKKWPLVLVSSYEIPHFQSDLRPTPSPYYATQEVHGEVYQVDDRMLEVLDRLESHPDYYVRSQEDVFMLSQPKSSTDANVEGTTPTPPTEAGDKAKSVDLLLAQVRAATTVATSRATLHPKAGHRMAGA